MSKIFEALKKVQAEVGRRPLDAEAPASEAPAGSADLDLPEGFVAELVSMRYSLEAKLSKAHRALAFACAVKGEGVSTVARIFSQILVQDPGSRVVLVDANAHSPTVHESFGVAIGPGLMDLLTGRKALAECLHGTGYPRLKIMPIGEAVAPPMQAFASDSMRKTITDILATNDYLVFDAPPVLLHPETTILSSQIDGVVFVVQAVRTKKEVVKKAIDAVTKGGGEALGLVLNRNKHFIPEFIYKRV